MNIFLDDLSDSTYQSSNDLCSYTTLDTPDTIIRKLKYRIQKLEKKLHLSVKKAIYWKNKYEEERDENKPNSLKEGVTAVVKRLVYKYYLRYITNRLSRGIAVA